ncbi:TatD family hydrolase [Parazoarcus communis]|uniref:TatD family deoxyribonuclease n=1 Tax=Parazoarcus communis SWub3 = DSM 12120 TaxID=1121029 RepID=A0A323URM7_9RHOO|nr:TatD family hydrolase [Parazoarcus communis]NMG71233.1 TatD family deoxyribonuclease [Parazoarcus communis SWub3 = DSM 12120]PZA14997.1 TatD family deoxyribonuclease [Azoarcus communis] [Parazoarcus communis SWub3 = DSM 12120]
MLIDSHIHLDAAEFDADRNEVLAAARAVGVGGFVVPAVDRASFLRIAELARNCPDVWPAYGLHPMYVDQAVDADIEALEHKLATSNCIAVGEIGLDFYIDVTDRKRQANFFSAQLKLAQRFDLPVILHLRRAQDEVLKHLRQTRVRGGVAHAFNGSRQQADAFIALGFKLGFGGAMTFEGSQRIRKLATELPLESIVLETDAPDMAPSWGRGQRNCPANLSRYAATLATLRGIPVDIVIRQTTLNVVEAFPRLNSRSDAPAT